MKLIVLIFGVAVGFGVGVYWGVHHPTQAATLSAQEEQQFLQAQIKLSEAVKAKLDSLASKPVASGKTFGSGFVSGGSSAPDPEISNLRDDQDRQIQQMKQRLQQLNQ